MDVPSFQNETVYILGGGPSLRDALWTMEDFHDNKRKVIAINDAIHAYCFCDLLFFRDPDWYLTNRNTVEAWQGPVVTSRLSPHYSEKIFVVNTKHCNDFMLPPMFEAEGYTIKYGRSGGHLALSLAISLGARRCVLLGFDCREVDGKTHFYRTEGNTHPVMLKNDFLPAWDGWGAAAGHAGVEVLNATPNSAILEFRYKPLVEILREEICSNLMSSS